MEPGTSFAAGEHINHGMLWDAGADPGCPAAVSGTGQAELPRSLPGFPFSPSQPETCQQGLSKWTKESKPSCSKQREGTEISRGVKHLSLNQGANPCYNILPPWAEVPASGKGRGECEQLTGAVRAPLCRQGPGGLSGLGSRKCQKTKSMILACDSCWVFQ